MGTVELNLGKTISTLRLTPGLVSIVVPTKNSSRTLSECLRSIREQTYPSIEIIVVDDYSSDNTRQIALMFSATIVLCGGERSRQVNQGVKIAQGEFVYRVDSDF